jgi:hypothetical protein
MSSYMKIRGGLVTWLAMQSRLMRKGNNNLVVCGWYDSSSMQYRGECIVVIL